MFVILTAKITKIYAKNAKNHPCSFAHFADS